METSAFSRDKLNELSSVILKAAIAVHREMGPGLLESVYHHCMIKELRDRHLQVNTIVPVRLHYKGEVQSKDYVIDILVENEIVLELKAHEMILPVHEAQLISYLKIANKRLGFLINFHAPLLKQASKDLSTVSKQMKLFA